ncbi:MAG: twin-arginine translocase TatA/TatE family subunit [Anaerolineae bacterium]|nr:twin-arginine translocase TatA/TatE family subunit [Anaerolineae bacterium]
MPSLGPFELIIILVIVVIFFGVGKLPEIGGAIGRSLAEFRNANRTDDSITKTPPDPAAS